MPNTMHTARGRLGLADQYRQMLEGSSQRLYQMEAHLKELVLVEKLKSSRVIEDEHRIVQPLAGNLTYITPFGYTQTTGPVLKWIVPQGETWICERVSVGAADSSITLLLFYRDAVSMARLAEAVTPLNDGGQNCFYSDSFSNTLYLPERTTLICIPYLYSSAKGLDGNLQVRVLKRHQNPLTQEETYALAGDLSKLETFYDERWADANPEPHDDRHGAVSLEAEGYGGDIEPPTPEPELRPQPHFGQRVIQEVEHLIDEIV